MVCMEKTVRWITLANAEYHRKEVNYNEFKRKRDTNSSLDLIWVIIL